MPNSLRPRVPGPPIASKDLPGRRRLPGSDPAGGVSCVTGQQATGQSHRFMRETPVRQDRS